jgi:ribosomal protein S18 acetylase RimI-like enzyme
MAARRTSGDLERSGWTQYCAVVGIDADTAASALAETWQHLQPAFPDGWGARDGGVFAGITGVQLPTLNGVWAERVHPDPPTVAALLDRIAATGLPHCLQLRPGSGPALAELAATRGMSKEEQDQPLMVLEDPATLGRAQHIAGLKIRQLRSDEAGVHARVAAAGFEAPRELFRQLITPGLLRLPGARCYLGEVGGRPVTTGIGVTFGDFVGIFNIATPPAQRRRGFGAAVTARAVTDGFAAGAAWSWLQSSPSGHGVYERLGFQTVECWPTWLSAA